MTMKLKSGRVPGLMANNESKQKNSRETQVGVSFPLPPNEKSSSELSAKKEMLGRDLDSLKAKAQEKSINRFGLYRKLSSV